MGFDVGAIVAHLTLDKKQWEQAITAVKKDQTSLQGSVLNNEKEIKKLGTSLTVAGGAIMGMFGLLIKGTVDAGDHINDLSKRTGIGTETLSAYQLAADKSGTSLDGFAIGMRGLANQMQAANDGSKESKKIFDTLGVSYVDNTGKLRPLDQVMLDVADRFAGMEDGAQKTALAQDVFGRSGMELIPMLNMGRKGLEENAEAARRYGMVLSKEAAQKMDEFNDSMAELKGSLAGLGREIITPLVPAIKGLIEKIANIAVRMREWIAEHPTLSSWIAKITLGMGLLMGAIGPVLMVLPGLVKGFQALKTLEIGKKLAGDFQGLGTEVTTLTQLLKSLPLVAVAAFAGWNIGKAIGDLTGYNKRNEESWSQLIDKLGLYKGKAEEADLTADRLGKRQLFLSTASQIAGKEISNLNEAIDIIKAAYEKSGTVGNKTLDDWAKKSNDADAATRKLSGGVSGLAKLLEEFGIKTRTELVKQLEDAKSALDQLRKSGEATPGAVKALQDKIKDLTEQLYGVDKAGKEFTDWLDGLVPKMSDVSIWLKKVDDLYAQGKISPAQYAAAMKDLTEKFDKLGEKINRILPRAWDMNKAWEEMRPKIGELPPVLEDVAYGFDDAQAALLYWSRELDLGIDKIMEANLAWLNFQFTLLRFGPLLAGINFNPMMAGARAEVKETDNAFAGLWNNVAQGFGQTITKWLQGASTFKDFMKGLWKDVFDGFTQWIGQKLTKAMTGFFDGIFSSTKKLVPELTKTMGDAASSVSSAVGGITQGAASAMSGLWTGLGAAVGSFLGTLLAGVFGGGPSGHQQEQQINDTKDSRNFLADIKNWFYSAGGGFGGAIYEFSTAHLLEKFDGLKGSVDDTRTSLWGRIGEAIGWLQNIELNTEPLKNITSAQFGMNKILTQPTLIAAHAGEQVTISPHFNLQATTIPVVLDGHEIMRVLVKYAPQYSKRGVLKINPYGVRE